MSQNDNVIRIDKCNLRTGAAHLKQKLDEELMSLYQNGNEEAFQILYERHAGKIFAFIKKRIKKEEQCRDVFQEVFSKIHKSKHLYNKTLPALPWIFTVTRTVLIDCLRKEKMTANSVDVDLNTLASPQEETRPEVNAILPHLSELPSSQEKALKLRYVEEKTFEEIASHLNTSTVNVRQLISRGIKRIREIVGET